VNTDPVGQDQEGTIPEEPNLEEADLGEEDFEAQDHDLQASGNLYSPSHTAREIPFSILGMSRILCLRPELRSNPVPAGSTSSGRG